MAVVIGAISALFALPRESAIAAVLCGLAAVGLVFAFRLQTAVAHKAVMAVPALALIAVGVLLQFFPSVLIPPSDARQQPSPPSSITPTAPPSTTDKIRAKLLVPAPNDTLHVNGCLPVQYEVNSLPDNLGLTVGRIMEGASRYFFETQVTPASTSPSSSTWNARVYLGDVNGGMGKQFTVTLYAAPKESIALYVSANEINRTAKSWSSEGVPSDLIQLNSFTRVRNNDTSITCP